MLGEDNVTRQLVDTVGGGSDGLLVKEDIPHTGGAVLGITSTVSVDVVLLRGGVGTDKSDEIIWADGLVLEEVDQVESVSVDVGEEVIGVSLLGVLATDKGAHARTEGACHSGDVGSHLNKVGVGDLVEAEVVVVLCVNLLVLLAHILQTEVLTTAEFTSQDDGTISTTALSCGLGRPCTSIVETHANGITSPLAAATRVTLEQCVQLIRDVLPHTASVSLAARCVHGGNSKVAIPALGVTTALENLLDVASDAGEGAVAECAEVAEELVGVEAIAGPAVARLAATTAAAASTTGPAAATALASSATPAVLAAVVLALTRPAATAIARATRTAPFVVLTVAATPCSTSSDALDLTDGVSHSWVGSNLGDGGGRESGYRDGRELHIVGV